MQTMLDIQLVMLTPVGVEVEDEDDILSVLQIIFSVLVELELLLQVHTVMADYYEAHVLLHETITQAHFL